MAHGFRQARAPPRPETVVVETDLVDDRGKHVARVTQTQSVLRG